MWQQIELGHDVKAATFQEGILCSMQRMHAAEGRSVQSGITLCFLFPLLSVQCKCSLQPWCSKWCHWLIGPRCQTVLTALRLAPTSRCLTAHPQRNSDFMRQPEEACVCVWATWQYHVIINNGRFIRMMTILWVKNSVFLIFFFLPLKWKKWGWFTKILNKHAHTYTVECGSCWFVCCGWSIKTACIIAKVGEQAPFKWGMSDRSHFSARENMGQRSDLKWHDCSHTTRTRTVQCDRKWELLPLTQVTVRPASQRCVWTDGRQQ